MGTVDDEGNVTDGSTAEFGLLAESTSTLCSELPSSAIELPDDDATLETLVFQWKGILLAYGHSKRLLDDEAARAQATAAYRMLIGG